MKKKNESRFTLFYFSRDVPPVTHTALARERGYQVEWIPVPTTADREWALETATRVCARGDAIYCAEPELTGALDSHPAVRAWFDCAALERAFRVTNPDGREPEPRYRPTEQDCQLLRLTEKEEEYLRRYFSGGTLHGTAREFGISHGLLNHLCNRRGLSKGRGSKSNITPENPLFSLRDIIADYQDKYLSVRELAEKYRCSTSFIWNAFARNDVKLRPRGPTRQRNRERNQAAVELYLSGKTVAEIAAMYGCTPSNIYQMFRREKFHCRPRGARRRKKNL